MRSLAHAMVLVAGCGRYNFEPLSGDDAHVPALTEDFESGALAARWRAKELNGKVVVDATRPHRGAYSLHAHSFATSAMLELNAMIQESETFPALENGLFARTFVYIARSGPIT